ncbi:MAG: hypothetical protein ACP5L2_08065, partial [Conexivisphaera sp.]
PSRESVPPPGVHAHGPATRVTDAAVVPLGVERMTTTVYVEPDAIRGPCVLKAAIYNSFLMAMSR